MPPYASMNDRSPNSMLPSSVHRYHGLASSVDVAWHVRFESPDVGLTSMDRRLVLATVNVGAVRSSISKVNLKLGPQSSVLKLNASAHPPPPFASLRCFETAGPAAAPLCPLVSSPAAFRALTRLRALPPDETARWSTFKGRAVQIKKMQPGCCCSNVASCC